MIKPGEKFYRVVEDAPVAPPVHATTGADATPAPGEQP
jgi:cell division protein FtsB